jgi:hypothetical protein
MRTLAVVLLFALGACSSGTELKQVRARYSPPNGFEFAGESAGPPARASFNPGVTLARFDRELPKGDADALAAALPQLADLGPDWSEVSAREGTLKLGPVVRVELSRKDGTRAMHYVIPRAKGFVLFSFSAPESSYGPMEAKVERSLNDLSVAP